MTSPELEQRDEFIRRIRELVASGAPLGGFFEPSRPVTIARAPGRLDVLGGIADYSGSLVLELPIREGALVAAQLVQEPRVRCVSVPWTDGDARFASLPCEALTTSYSSARSAVAGLGESAWAGYLVGPLTALALELGVPFAGGARILVSSQVPEGKGVSSSAALEVAALYALAGCAGVALEARQAALLAQKAENRVVGAPCGVMDPMTVSCGRAGELLELLCQPATIVGTRAMRSDLACFGIDSGVRHAVSGADYAQVRTAAFMGYRWLADSAHLSARSGPEPHKVQIDDPRWGGYLANVTPSEIEGGLGSLLPETIRGADFLSRFGGITDDVVAVDPSVTYPVRAATLHPIHEHHRVRLFVELLSGSSSERSRRLLGEILYLSHASYSACGLGSSATDALVQLVRESGPARGLYGAKITGGGSGGTVAVLGRADSLDEVERIAARYRREHGRGGYVFSGSSAGAADFGVTSVAL